MPSKRAGDLKDALVGPEHLLIGLLREETGVAACVLGHLTLGLDAVRAEVMRLREEDKNAGPDE